MGELHMLQGRVGGLSPRGESVTLPARSFVTLMDTLNLDSLVVGTNEEMMGFQSVDHCKQQGLRAKFPSDRVLRSRNGASQNSFSLLSND